MNKNTVSVAWLILILSLVVGACAPAVPSAQPAEPAEPAVPAAPPADAKVLKVGVLAPFTGPSARVGEEFKGAVTMAFDAIDWTVGDYTIEVVWIDGESDPEKATRAYEAAITRDGIQVGLLNWDASEVIPLMDLVAKYKVPHFFAMGTSEDIDTNQMKSTPIGWARVGPHPPS
jgi:ABC-type branched-subunit amino acid transport system substrate-binding protein